MCDRYSQTHGYLCDDCFKELLLTEGDVWSFMCSRPKELFDKIDWREEMEDEFPIT